MADVSFNNRARVLPGVSVPTTTTGRQDYFEHSVVLNALLTPLMYMLGAYVQMKKAVLGLFGVKPKTNAYIFDGVSINGRRTKEGAARHGALNAVYNFREGEGATVLERVCDDAWLRIRNAEAVRNRLKIVKREVRVAVMSVDVEDDGPVRILSLAAGTAQGVLEAMHELRSLGYRTKAVLVDQDASALAYAKTLVAKYGLEDSVDFAVGNVLFFDRAAKDFRPHVVEMCGLMDYLEKRLAEKLVRKIRLKLEAGGFFVTCHIHPNPERYFLRHVVDWDMSYRSIAQFREILIEGGFLDPQLHTEPHGIHSVASCQKL